MKSPNRRSGLLFSFCCYVLATLFQSQPSSAAITVQTTDGRILTGEVDAQTDDQHLWIRQEKAQILMTTSVPWSSISAAANETVSLPLERLPELLRQQATNEPNDFFVKQVTYNSPTDQLKEVVGTVSVRPPTISRLAEVRSLDVVAFLVNLDHDVEPDGLELVIAARDKHGMPVPVKGSLDVRLWGERIQPHGSLVQYEDLEQWSQPVMPVDFENGLASYAIPFRTVRPEFDVGLHSDALVNVRLSVFGQGSYSASALVQIRSFNPVRDRLQLTRGGRFFPDELTQETRHQLRKRTHTRPLRVRR